ncbi:MAG TPA: glycosyltransferase family 2 protein [Thermoanaerobaculia bacterium]|jgi:glycosyltransferase involved in cell wall biosynthesis|nr:glycosyltransferase family 2 protein [Thermoanaerobaculia bacterium]
MAYQKPLLSVISPCYNESAVIGLFYQTLRPVLESLDQLDFEMVFVDDGSSDDTLEQLNRLAQSDPALRVLALSRNFGHQVALTAGIDHAAGDAVVMMDSDLQHPPSVIPELVLQWRAGHDVVNAIRQSTDGEGWFKGLTSRGFYALLNALSGTKVPPGAADFCLLSRRVCQSLRDMPERHRFLRGLVSWAGFDRAFVPYVAPQRAAGRTKYSVVKMVGLALDAVFSFSAEPLRLALRAGLGITIFGFAYLAYSLIYGYLLSGLVPGYSSLIALMMILGGSQLMFIGLIGQYLARIFEEVKGRPIYLLKQEPPEARVRLRAAERG